jgi:signal transduction histidine kinase/CheY-like chemotaxis protein/AraC-like DNA-binding protein
MRQLWLFLVLCIPFASFGQDEFSGSTPAEGILNLDTTKLNDYDKGLLKEFSKVFESNSEDSLKFEAYHNLVQNLDDLNLILYFGSRLLEYSDSLLNVWPKEKRSYVLQKKTDCLSVYSWAVGAVGNTDKALELSFVSLRITEELKDSNLIAYDLTSIGVLYQNRSEDDKAIKYLKNALSYLENSTDYEALCYATSSLGGVLYRKRELDESKEWFMKSIDYAQLLGDNVLLARCYSYLSKISLKDKTYDIGIEHNKSAIALLENDDDQTLLASVYKDGAMLYYAKGDFKNAELSALKSLSFKRYYNQSTRKSAYFYLSRAQSEQGKYKEAYENNLKYMALSDSLRAIVSEREIAEQEVKYNYEKKSIADSLATAAKVEISQLEVEKKERETQYLWIGIGAFMILVFFLYRGYNTNKKQKEQLAIERSKLNESNSKLLELDKMKSDFFTNVSHEFRTPLTVISGMAGQIVKDPESHAIPGGEMIKRSSGDLLRLVEQILELRKLEVGNVTFKYKEGNVVDFIGNTIYSLDSYAMEQKIKLSFEASQSSFNVAFDKDKLQSIVVNLAANAIKYNKANGQVNCFFENDLNFYKITVSDNGLGISEENQKKVFERFYRVDQSETRETEGTGVGLSLVKEMVELMDGAISLQSELSKGTTIIVTLPITHVEERHAALSQKEKFEEEASPAPDNDLKDAEHLLIIEDNDQIREYLKSLLRGSYKLSFAKNGEEGVEKAIENVPDIILSDVMMPRKSGFEVLQELKTDERTNHIPIVLLTAKADVESRLSGLKKGADAYLAKPFQEEELGLVLKNLIEQRERIRVKYSDTSYSPKEEKAPTEADLFIIKVQELIHENLDNSTYGILEMCSDLAMSRTQLHNKLKSLSGLSTSHYIRKIKIEKAKELLKDSNVPVSEVAYALGFNSPSYFSTVFTEVTQVSPKQFQEQQKS